MVETAFLRNTKEADIERSTEEIRHDIAKEKENISQTVEQIGERLKEKLDWRGYVKDSPYWALGAAVGLGYLASGMFKTRTTPLERIMDSIAEKAGDSLGGMFARAAGPGLIKVTLLGVATIWTHSRRIATQRDTSRRGPHVCGAGDRSADRTHPSPGGRHE